MQKLSSDNLNHNLSLAWPIKFEEQQPLGMPKHKIIILDQHGLGITNQACLNMR